MWKTHVYPSKLKIRASYCRSLYVLSVLLSFATLKAADTLGAKVSSLGGHGSIKRFDETSFAVRSSADAKASTSSVFLVVMLRPNW